MISTHLLQLLQPSSDACSPQYHADFFALQSLIPEYSLAITGFIYTPEIALYFRAAKERKSAHFQS
jgi:hypothetical protein